MTEFNPAIHKTKKDGSPLLRRGNPIVDRNKMAAKKEIKKDSVVGDGDRITYELTIAKELPESALSILREINAELKYDGDIATIRRGSHITCMNIKHPEQALRKAANEFRAQCLGHKGDVGKSANERIRDWD